MYGIFTVFNEYEQVKFLVSLFSYHRPQTL